MYLQQQAKLAEYSYVNVVWLMLIIVKSSKRFLMLSGEFVPTEQWIWLWNAPSGPDSVLQKSIPVHLLFSALQDNERCFAFDVLDLA